MMCVALALMDRCFRRARWETFLLPVVGKPMRYEVLHIMNCGAAAPGTKVFLFTISMQMEINCTFLA
jgi:hypothetical protein